MALTSVTLNPGVGGSLVAVDQVGGASYQYTKLTTGGVGVVAEVSSSNPLWVTFSGGAVTNAGTFPVQLTAALPAGTNAIGKLAANSGVDIGDVDVLSVANVVPGTGATNLGKAMGSVGGSTDTGVALLGLRTDSLA